MLLGACAAAGFAPRFVVDSQDYATARGFAAAGPGIAPIPESTLDGPRPTTVVVRRTRSPEPTRRVYAAVRTSAPPQPALRTFLAGLRDAASR